MQRWLALASAVVAIVAVAWLVRLAARPGGHTAQPDAATAVPETSVEATLDPARWSPRPPSTTAKLEGWVGDPARHGIVGATVCATAFGEDLVDDDQVPYCVTTGEDGRYVFAALPHGQYDVSASAAHHVPGYAKDPVTLEAGRVADAVDVILSPGGVAVRGLVEDPLGRPVPGARVTATPGEGIEAGPAVAFTDAEGRYTLWVPPGSTFLEVVAKDHVRAERDATAPSEHEDFALVFGASVVGLVEDEAGIGQPGVVVRLEVENKVFEARTGVDGSYRLDGLPAGEASLDARGDGLFGGSLVGVPLAAGDLAAAPRLTMHPVARVLATVRSEAGPCKEGRVSLDVDGAHADAPIGLHGVATLRAVHAGKALVRVACVGFVEKTGTLEVGASGTVQVTYDVVRGAEVEGVVVDASGKPVPDGHAWFYPKGAGSHTSGAVKAGAFRVTGVLAGVYDVRVGARGFAESKVTITVGGVSVVKTRVVLATGATVEGTVVDALGAPMAGAAVELLDAKGDEVAQGTVGPRGEFVLSDLAATAGTLRVTRGLTTLPLLGPTSEGVPIVVTAGAAHKKALVVEACSHRIRGTVVDAAGAPKAGVTVEVRRTTGDGYRAYWTEVTTDAHGAFVVPQLLAGAYSLGVLAPGGAAHATVTADAAVTLTLAPYGRIVGRIVGAKRRIHVTAEHGDLQVFRAATFFATDGAFVFGALPAGTYSVRTATDDLEAVETVTVTAGAETTVTLMPTKGPLPSPPAPE